MKKFVLNYKNFEKTNKAQKRKFIKKILDILEKKSGFAVVKNFNIDRSNLPTTEKNYKLFLLNLGSLLEQNIKKEKVSKVMDHGKSWSAKNRGYKTNDYIPFHTDGGTFASLLCVQNSSVGGETIITKAKEIYKTLKKDYPKTLKILEKGFHYHTRGETKGVKNNISKKKYPVFFFKKNKLHCMFNKKPIIWALKEQEKQKKLNHINDHLKALNNFEKLSNRKKNIYKFKLKSGEILLYNNYKVLHGREKFKDKSSSKRILLRSWIKAKNSNYVGLNLLDAYRNK
tara:strand:- start:62 stop:916 length:855 start_codon:yes stop_codon:yes gene_type:complete